MEFGFLSLFLLLLFNLYHSTVLFTFYSIICGFHVLYSLSLIFPLIIFWPVSATLLPVCRVCLCVFVCLINDLPQSGVFGSCQPGSFGSRYSAHRVPLLKASNSLSHTMSRKFDNLVLTLSVCLCFS